MWCMLLTRVFQVVDVDLSVGKWRPTVRFGPNDVEQVLVDLLHLDGFGEDPTERILIGVIGVWRIIEYTAYSRAIYDVPFAHSLTFRLIGMFAYYCCLPTRNYVCLPRMNAPKLSEGQTAIHWLNAYIISFITGMWGHIQKCCKAIGGKFSSNPTLSVLQSSQSNSYNSTFHKW